MMFTSIWKDDWSTVQSRRQKASGLPVSRFLGFTLIWNDLLFANPNERTSGLPVSRFVGLALAALPHVSLAHKLNALFSATADSARSGARHSVQVRSSFTFSELSSHCIAKMNRSLSCGIARERSHLTTRDSYCITSSRMHMS